MPPYRYITCISDNLFFIPCVQSNRSQTGTLLHNCVVLEYSLWNEQDSRQKNKKTKHRHSQSFACECWKPCAYQRFCDALLPTYINNNNQAQSQTVMSSKFCFWPVFINGNTLFLWSSAESNRWICTVLCHVEPGEGDVWQQQQHRQQWLFHQQLDPPFPRGKTHNPALNCASSPFPLKR